MKNQTDYCGRRTDGDIDTQKRTGTQYCYRFGSSSSLVLLSRGMMSHTASSPYGKRLRFIINRVVVKDGSKFYKSWMNFLMAMFFFVFEDKDSKGNGESSI